MLLRSISKHVKDQNWFAVALDFFIVVFGVFMGFQVQAWNKDSGNQQEYKLALERLVDEAKANIVILDDIHAIHVDDLDRVRLGLKALRSCENTPDNAELIEAALAEITGTTTIHLQTSALNEMTTSPLQLAQQAPETRNIFKTAKFNLDVLKAEADFSETLPFRDRPETNPILGLEDKIGNNSLNNIYHGIDTTRSIFSLTLAETVDVACHNDQLLKSFYTWYRFQSAIPVYAASMRTEMQNIIKAAELKSEHNSEATP